MRPQSSPVLTSPTYRGYPINASPATPCFQFPLDRIIDRFENIENMSPSVMPIMVVLTFPQQTSYEAGNHYMVRLMNSLCWFLGNKKWPYAYLWVPELSQDGGFHFHLWLVVGTNWPQAFHVIIDKIKAYWASVLNIPNADGLVHYGSANNGTILHKIAPDYEQARNACIYHASYLAKTHTKDQLPPHCKGFGGSQLAPSL